MPRTFTAATLILTVATALTGCSNASDETATGGSPAASTTSASEPTPSTSPTRALASPEFTTACTAKDAVDLTDEDPFHIVVKDLAFEPNCFIVRLDASVEIENKDDVGHTFTIDDTVVNAPLVPSQTYTHGPNTGFLNVGAYAFHCKIHPQMTGTMILV